MQYATSPAMAPPLTTGLQWEEDPAGNANTHDGRTHRRYMRATSDSTFRVVVKRPKPGWEPEIYAIGMERVAHVLGEAVGVPIPATYLETVDGYQSSLQRFIVNGRSWKQKGAAPMMAANVLNTEVYALSALFDVWMANTDRSVLNFQFEPEPPGAFPGKATGCRMWLIDHGTCGLWPANKLDEHRDPTNVPESIEGITGTLWDAAEKVISGVMPAEYRMALKQTTGNARDQLLDRVRGIGDDVVRSAVAEIPDDYMTSGHRDATVAFLMGRQQQLDTVLSQYW